MLLEDVSFFACSLRNVRLGSFVEHCSIVLSIWSCFTCVTKFILLLQEQRKPSTVSQEQRKSPIQQCSAVQCAQFAGSLHCELQPCSVACVHVLYVRVATPSCCCSFCHEVGRALKAFGCVYAKKIIYGFIGWPL